MRNSEKEGAFRIASRRDWNDGGGGDIVDGGGPMVGSCETAAVTVDSRRNLYSRVPYCEKAFPQVKDARPAVCMVERRHCDTSIDT